MSYLNINHDQDEYDWCGDGDEWHGCLSVSTDYENTVWDMGEGCRGMPAPYEPDVIHRVMDMMERDLGVTFTQTERNGYVCTGHGNTSTVRDLHRSVLPFRIFLESGLSRNNGAPAYERSNATLFRELLARGVGEWGALMVLHSIQVNVHGLNWGCYGDQQWWLDLHTQYSNECIADALYTRTVALFPELSSRYLGVDLDRDVSEVGYSMNLWGARVSDRWNGSRRQFYTAITEFKNAALSPESPSMINSFDDIIALANIYQGVFDECKAESDMFTGMGVTPAPAQGMTFLLESVLEREVETPVAAEDAA